MLLFLLIFVIALAATLIAIAAASVFFESRQKSVLDAALRFGQPALEQRARVDLMTPETNPDAIEQAISKYGFGQRIALYLAQSGTGWTAGVLLLFCGFAALIGAIAGWFGLSRVIPSVGAATTGALCGVVAPLVLVKFRRSKRIKQFEEQFPDALDFLARSMRAGHGFSASLEMLGVETAEPLGSAVRRLSGDLQLGATLSQAFEKLATNVPLVDVRFFTAAVLMQQETGGNLSEILDRLAYVIRERFKLAGDVRAASAHGRITALVLFLLPVFVATAISVIDPDFLGVLFKEKEGRWLLAWAVLGQLVGGVVIQKMVNIKV